MPRVSLHARSAAALAKPSSQNRGGVASSSTLLSIIKRAPLAAPRKKAEKNTTASAPPPRSLLPRVVPRASLWDSLFGGGEGDKKAAAKKEEQEEGDVALLDPGSLPACLPEAVLSRTFLAGRALAVSYVASRDGWSALRFHEKCDFKGPSLVVAETSDGAVFGGYFSDCWTSSDDYSTSWKPFLFTFSDEDEKKPLEGREVFICEKVGGPEAALFDYARGGPQFGADGLSIGQPLSPVMGGFAGPDSPTQGAGDLRTAKSRLGLSYAELPKRGNGRRRSLFGKGAEEGGGGGEGRDEATLKEVTVYFAPELAKLYR